MLICPDCRLPITKDADVKRKRATCVCKERGISVSILHRVMQEVWDEQFGILGYKC